METHYFWAFFVIALIAGGAITLAISNATITGYALFGRYRLPWEEIKPIARCGDGICQVEIGENYNNCCIDCPCPTGSECINNTCRAVGFCKDYECVLDPEVTTLTIPPCYRGICKYVPPTPGTAGIICECVDPDTLRQIIGCKCELKKPTCEQYTYTDPETGVAKIGCRGKCPDPTQICEQYIREDGRRDCRCIEVPPTVTGENVLDVLSQCEIKPITSTDPEWNLNTCRNVCAEIGRTCISPAHLVFQFGKPYYEVVTTPVDCYYDFAHEPGLGDVIWISCTCCSPYVEPILIGRGTGIITESMSKSYINHQPLIQ